jgi:two-component system, LuxR family, response regulator FixJ
MFIDQKVFVVDDDEFRVDGLTSTLQAYGIRCAAFRTAEEFLAEYSDAPGQRRCLVVNADLPFMSGLELQRQLRERGVIIPVVFVAEGATAATFTEAVQNGAIGFFEGSFDDGALMMRVRESLEGSSAQPALALE